MHLSAYVVVVAFGIGFPLGSVFPSFFHIFFSQLTKPNLSSFGFTAVESAGETRHKRRDDEVQLPVPGLQNKMLLLGKAAPSNVHVSEY